MSRTERRWYGPARPWLCHRAVGRTLEVAVGTGLNLPHYPPGTDLTGIERSRSMLAVAEGRAAALGLDADLRQGDARALPFDDASFDTVVMTFSLCSVDDEHQAVAELARVLRPGGLLLLADHVESTSWAVRSLQRLLDLVSVPLQGERHCHRPLRQVEAMGFVLEAHERTRHGALEKLAARRPVRLVDVDAQDGTRRNRVGPTTRTRRTSRPS